MIGKPLQRQGRVILGLIALLGSAVGLEACGDFSLPQNHFEGVTALGYVSIWNQIGSLDLGEVKVPVIMGFQTYRQQPSAELGSGWFLPLMDANIVQTDEKTFRMSQPDGKNETLKRDKENPAILHGTGGWTAEIVGNDIVVHSQCGSGWKLVYTQGKLISLSKGDHTLTIERDALGRGIAARDGAKSVMTLEQDEVTGLAKSITIGDAKYELTYDAKPRVETINGVNMVGGVDQSLHQISFPTQAGGQTEKFDFAVTDKLLPDLKITGTDGKERTIVWDTVGHILQDGEWKYTAKSQEVPNANIISIERKNAQGQSESWNKDEVKGEEVTQNLDGTKTVKTWYTSGKLAGRERCIKQFKGTTEISFIKSIYDEKGNKIRLINNDGDITTYEYNLNGEFDNAIFNSKNTEIRYDKKFNITRYTEKGTRIKFLIAGKDKIIKLQ